MKRSVVILALLLTGTAAMAQDTAMNKQKPKDTTNKQWPSKRDTSKKPTPPMHKH